MTLETTTPPRTAILELAIVAIEEGGETAVRINDLTDAAGVGPPLLYRAFGSREGLVVAAQAERYRRALRVDQRQVAALEACESAEQFRDAVCDLLDGVAVTSRAAVRRTRMHVLGTSITRPELLDAIHEIEEQYLAAFLPALERAQRLGWILEDLDLWAWLTWQMSHVNSWANIELHDERPVDGWRDIARAAALHSLFGADIATTVAP
jgi:AcrR family transcriptional regulator